MNQDWANDWYLLGATADVDNGTVSRRTIGHVHLAVFSMDGNFYAASDACRACSHSLAGGIVSDNAVQCPNCAQRLRIAFDTSNANDAVGHPLATYPVMVVNDEIFAWIEELD